MKNLYLVTMRSTDGSTFAINDINEISKYFKNIYIIPLLKDLIIKKEPIYRDNVKIIRSIPKKINFYECIHIIKKFFQITLIVLFSKDKILDKIKLLVLLPKSLTISNYINRTQPDNVHLFWGHFPSLVILGLKKNISSKISIFMGAYDLRKKLLVSKLAAQRSDFIFTHVRENINIIKNFTSREKNIDCIYRGVNLNEFEKLDSYNKKKFSFCTIGLLEKHKRIDQVINVFYEIKKKYINSTLIIIGTGSLEKKLKEKVSQLKLNESIKFTGWLSRKKVAEIFSETQFYLHFSNVEALPNSIKEAMYTKCFCLSSETFGIQELLEDKKTGFIIDPNNIKQILNTIEFCLDSQDKNLNELLINARSHIINNFNLHKNIKLFCKKIL